MSITERVSQSVIESDKPDNWATLGSTHIVQEDGEANDNCNITPWVELAWFRRMERPGITATLHYGVMEIMTTMVQVR